MKKYYALEQNGNEVDVFIFGDITSWEYLDNDISSYTLSKVLQDIKSDVINVHINSYGGEVAEGLAIYNMLKNHSAKVKTFCDGFACSIASVIFMAGDERVMNNSSLLMIHNAWMRTGGNANQLRKDADDLDIINSAAIAAYMEKVNISQDELQTLLDNESWINPQTSLDKGFATSIIGSAVSENKAAADARKSLYQLLNDKITNAQIGRAHV